MLGKMKDSPKETVDHPDHYQGQGIEVIDIIDSFELDFYRGNIVKYILRADKKENEIQDLKKAKWYLEKLITKMENYE
jgi:hypothetical protein